MGMASPARVAGLATALLAAGLTIGVTVTPGIHFAYHRPVLHAGLETAESLVAFLVAYLVIGRLKRTRSLDDLVLAVALAMLALGTLGFAAIPALVAEGQPDPVSSWAGIWIRILSALLFAVAAFTPRRQLVALGRASIVAAVYAATAIALVVAGVWSLRGSLPAVAPPAQAEAAAVRPDLFAHHGVFAIQLVAMILYTLAAIGFARRAEQRPGDDLLRWLGIGAIFATYAWLNYFLSPALFYADWVYTGDFFRLLFFSMLLVGAVREINGYWSRSALVAVLEERRRLARDLHDGLAQEIAYINRAAMRLGDEDPDHDLPERLAAAAGRALRESRQVIAALATPVDEPLEAMVGRVVHAAADRFGTAAELDIASGVRLDAARTEGLLRIIGEAVANAAQHSGARSVRVELERLNGSARLRVVDKGSGFDTDTTPPTGFGLISMRERAEALGGRFAIDSKPGRGTRIEVLL
jgi:signal transduction histidine kinase